MNALLPNLKKYPPILWAVTFFMLMADFTRAEMPKAVSIDYCADQYLLALADPSQIIAVSNSATDQHSFYRKKAAELNRFAATAEQIIALNPEIVIGTDGAYNVLTFLTKYDINTVIPEFGHEVNTHFKNLAMYGDVLNRTDQANKIIENYQSRLGILKQKTRKNITVAYLTPSGFTAGTGTFIDDIIKLAGLNSFAEVNNLVNWQPLSLELMLVSPPDLIISSFFDQDDVHISHWSLTRHPEIDKMIKNIPTITVPGDILSCSGLFSIEAAEYIREAADQALNKKGEK